MLGLSTAGGEICNPLPEKAVKKVPGYQILFNHTSILSSFKLLQRAKLGDGSVVTISKDEAPRL